MTFIDSDDRLPLYQRLKDELIRRVAAQDWLPGSPIPTEAELTHAYGVSSGTVRKAVDLLVADGLLERFQGRGTYVRRPQFDASLFRFFRVQHKQGQRQVPESRVLLREARNAPADVAEALKLADGEQVLYLERVRLIEGVPVLAEEIWLPLARFGALLTLDTDEFGALLYPLYESLCGQAVAAADESLTVELVEGRIAERLELTIGAPVVVIERLARGYDGQPLEWRRSRGNAKEFRYQVEIR